MNSILRVCGFGHTLIVRRFILDSDQDNARFDHITFSAIDRHDRTRDRRTQRLLHLHRLKHDEDLTCLNAFSQIHIQLHDPSRHRRHATGEATTLDGAESC